MSLKYGHQQFLQRRISSKASIGKLLFQNGHKLFSNMSLTADGDPAVASRREAVSKEFAELSDRLTRISSIAQAEHFGVNAPSAVPDSRRVAGAS